MGQVGAWSGPTTTTEGATPLYVQASFESVSQCGDGLKRPLRDGLSVSLFVIVTARRTRPTAGLG
jgi:hypothetical protein